MKDDHRADSGVRGEPVDEDPLPDLERRDHRSAGDLVGLDQERLDPEREADGDREGEARVAARELAGAMRMVRAKGEWAPPVVTCSGLHDHGVDGVWEQVLGHRAHLGEDGLRHKRARQQLDFTWALVRDELDQRLRHSPGVRAIRERIRAEVLAGDLPATVAADRLLAAYDEGDRAAE